MFRIILEYFQKANVTSIHAIFSGVPFLNFFFFSDNLHFIVLSAVSHHSQCVGDPVSPFAFAAVSAGY